MLNITLPIVLQIDSLTSIPKHRKSCRAHSRCQPGSRWWHGRREFW